MNGLMTGGSTVRSVRRLGAGALVMLLAVSGCGTSAPGTGPVSAGSTSCPSLASLDRIADRAGKLSGVFAARYAKAACYQGWALGDEPGTRKVQASNGFFRRGSAGYRLVLLDDSGCQADDALQAGMPLTVLQAIDEKISHPYAPPHANIGC